MRLVLTVTATEASGSAMTIPGVDIALCQTRQTPTAATVWTPMTWAAPSASIVVAGSSADATGAFVLSDSGDLWIRITNWPELIVSKVGGVKII